MKAIESDWFNAQAAAEEMANAFAIPGDTPEEDNDPRRQQARYATDAAVSAKDRHQDLEMWLERKCRPGCRLFLYQHRRKDTLRSGYCVVKNGACITSLVLSENDFDREAVFIGKTPFLKILEGDGQTAAPGEIAPVPLVVELKDATGKPIANAPLIFQVDHYFALRAAGSLRNPTSGEDGKFDRMTYQMTDSNGQARAFFRQPFRSNCKQRLSLLREAPT